MSGQELNLRKHKTRTDIMSKSSGNRKKGKGQSTKENVGHSTTSCTEQVPILLSQSVAFKCNTSGGKTRKFATRTIVCNKTELPAYRIHKIESFLQPQECEYFINWAENHGFEECQQAEIREYAHRENGRIQIDDADLAQQIYSRLLPLLPSTVDGIAPRGCSSNVRFYRYTVGQRFGKHIDESHHDEALCGVTKYTLLIYLNGSEPMASQSSSSTAATNAVDCPSDVSAAQYVDNHITEVDIVKCTGGDTVFYKRHHDTDALLEVSPQMGMLLLHGHGSKCLTHEGREVTSGVKYLLRTDVVYG